jgi:hypothetical protein
MSGNSARGTDCGWIGRHQLGASWHDTPKFLRSYWPIRVGARLSIAGDGHTNPALARALEWALLILPNEARRLVARQR